MMSQSTDFQEAKKQVLALLEEDNFNSYSDKMKLEVLRALVEALVYRMPGWVHDPDASTVSPAHQVVSSLISEPEPKEPA